MLPSVNNNLIKYFLVFVVFAGISMLLYLSDYSHKSVLIVLAVVLTAVIIKDYLIGLYLICFLIPLDAVATIIPGFSFTKYIGIITIASFIIEGIMHGKTKFKNFSPYLLAFFAWAGLSVLWALDLSVYFSRIMNLANYMVFIFMMINIRKPEVNVNRFLILYLAGCVILSAMGTQQFIIYGGLERTSAFGEDQNFYGITIGIGLLIALYLKRLPGYFTKHTILNISILLLIVGLMVSMSRTAWVATIIAVMFFFLVGRENKVKSVLISAGLVGIVYLIALYMSSVFESSLLSERVLSIINFTDSSNRAAGRLDIWIVGWNIFKDHFLLGVGLNNFSVAFTDQYVMQSEIVRNMGIGRDAHNIYLGVATELGLIGFTLLISVFVSSLKKIRNSKLDFNNKYFAYSIIIFLLVAGFANTILYKKYFWFSLAIVWLLIQGSDSVGKQKNNHSFPHVPKQH